MVMDTSCYPKFERVEKGHSFRNAVENAVSNTFDIPKNFVIIIKCGWHDERSEEDIIEVHLIARDENDKLKILNKWNSASLLTDMNMEIRENRELAEGKVKLKSIVEPSQGFSVFHK